MIFTYIFLHRIIESNRQLGGNHTHALCFFNKGLKQRTWTGTFSINYSYETRFPYMAKKPTILSMINYKDQLKSTQNQKGI